MSVFPIDFDWEKWLPADRWRIRSSYPVEVVEMGLVLMLYDQTGTGISDMGASKPEVAYLYRFLDKI